MHKILFVSCLLPKEGLQKIISYSKNTMQFAASKLQWNLIDGIEENLNSSIDVINLKAVGTFPNNYKIPFSGKSLIKSTKYNKNYTDLSFLNLQWIHKYDKYRILKNAVFKWIKKTLDDKITIIIYSTFRYYFKLIEKIKKNFPNITIVLVLPDLPVFTSLTESNKSKLKAENTNNIFLSKLNLVDKFVLITKYMAEYLKLDNNRYCVVEGIGNINGTINQTVESNEKTILYSGTLTKIYGIMNLVSAFKLIDDSNLRLVICGEGEAKQDIIKSMEEDFRIKYVGNITIDEVAILQKTATVLVNPRQNNGEYTKYSFPSKLMEYLSSGKPVICYKLDGIPQEYDDYFIYVKDNSINSLKESIIEVCQLSNDELNRISTRNIEFIKNEKSPKVQTKKILEMCNIKRETNVK